MATYRKVSAAEKYAELEARGEERPVGKYWSPDGRLRAGGQWKDLEKKRARNRRCMRKYRQTDKGRASKARAEAGLLQVKVGGMRFYYRVPPDKKDELKQRLADFRELQKEEYLGWIDSSVSRDEEMDYREARSVQTQAGI